MLDLCFFLLLLLLMIMLVRILFKNTHFYSLICHFFHLFLFVFCSLFINIFHYVKIIFFLWVSLYVRICIIWLIFAIFSFSSPLHLITWYLITILGLFVCIYILLLFKILLWVLLLRLFIVRLFLNRLFVLTILNTIIILLVVVGIIVYIIVRYLDILISLFIVFELMSFPKFVCIYIRLKSIPTIINKSSWFSYVRLKYLFIMLFLNIRIQHAPCMFFLSISMCMKHWWSSINILIFIIFIRLIICILDWSLRLIYIVWRTTLPIHILLVYCHISFFKHFFYQIHK